LPQDCCFPYSGHKLKRLQNNDRIRILKIIITIVFLSFFTSACNVSYETESVGITIDSENGSIAPEPYLSTIDPRKFTFPDRKYKAFVISFDDGMVQDRKLVEIFNRYGIKGTFHLGSGFLGQEASWMEIEENYYVTAEEIADLYAGHEISSHTINHPHLETLSEEDIRHEVLDDKLELERITGGVVTSLAYPFGTYSDLVIEVISDIGITNARTINETGNFLLPENLYQWHPTCHISNAIAYGNSFLALANEEMSLFQIWGHSWEMEYQNVYDWNFVDDFCKMIGNKNDIWYASAGEVADYINGILRLMLIEGNTIYNPADNITVWIKNDDSVVELNPGESLAQ